MGYRISGFGFSSGLLIMKRLNVADHGSGNTVGYVKMIVMGALMHAPEGTQQKGFSPRFKYRAIRKYWQVALGFLGDFDNFSLSDGL